MSTPSSTSRRQQRRTYAKPRLQPKGDIRSRTLNVCDTKTFGSEDGFFFISPSNTIGCVS